MRKNLSLFFFTLLVFLSSFLFALRASSSQIAFTYDQARDAFESSSIWNNHDLKILGPSSDVPGLNHGVLWYYFLAPLYGVSGGNPEMVSIAILCLTYLFIPILGVIAYKLSKNVKLSLITVLLYAFSPLVIAFSHWISNPILSLFIAPVLLFLLWRYIQKQNKVLAFLIGLGYGLMIQSDFAFLVLTFTVPLFIYFFKIKLRMSGILLFLGGLLTGLSTFILTYIKFHTNVFHIVSSFLVDNTGAGFSTSSSLLLLLDTMVNILSVTFLPFPKMLIFFLLAIVTFLYRKKVFNIKNKLMVFLLTWSSGILFIFIFNHGKMIDFLYAPFIFSTALLMSLVLSIVTNKNKYIYGFLGLIIFFQVLLINSWVNKCYTPLSIQKCITTKSEKEVIDYTYKEAGNKPFIINSITSPLYINTTWAYLYGFYGKNKYNYLPIWGGKDQSGYLGKLPTNATSGTKLRYLIIEPEAGIPDLWKTRIIFDEDTISDLIEERKFGEIIVQKRLMNPNKKDLKVPAILELHPEVFEL